jgi:hypothetical protein
MTVTVFWSYMNVLANRYNKIIMQMTRNKCISTPSITSELTSWSFKYGTFRFIVERKFPRKSAISIQ